MANIFILFLVSLFAGTIGALSGIGGGIILKPVLDLTTGLDALIINFLSGSAVLAMSMLSIIRYPKNSAAIEKQRGIPLALGAALGGLAGRQLFQQVVSSTGNTVIITSLQSIILGMLMLGMIIYMKHKEKIRPLDIQNKASCWAVGLVLGIISAFLGIGGGPINIAVIAYFLKMDAKNTALHSLLVIFCSHFFSIASYFVTKTVPAFDYRYFIPLLAGAFGGALLGTAIAKNVSNKKIEKMFSIIMYFILAITVFNNIHLMIYGRL